MVGTPREVLSHKILMLNIKALAPTVPMLLARLMFKKIRSNSKDGMPDRLKTICTPPPPDLRSRRHKKKYANGFRYSNG